MRTFSSALLIGGAALALAAGTVAAQDRPESILPPGFGQPAPAPPADQPPAEPAPPPPAEAPLAVSAEPAPGNDAAPGNTAAEALPPPAYVLPDYARRSLDRVGLGGDDALPADAFGRADGRFLQALMRRIDAPIASRWLSIALRRTLTAAIDTPAGVNGADFAAERAWLLVRMGEAVAARAVVQGVDPDNATAKLVQVTMQAALAAGDPAALCPFADTGLATTRERGWVLARAMCLGLAGEPGPAGAAIRAARRQRIGTDEANGIDLSLAEKVVGAGAQGRRAVTVEWPGVDRLTAWRWGLAAATGVEVPADLFATAGPQVRAWHALAPMYPAAARAADAELAAAQGVFSNLALVDLYGAIDDAAQGSAAAAGSVARDLRTAYVGDSAAERIAALRTLWDQPDSAAGRYARLVLTARAAARLRPGDGGADADRLVAAMLSAGLDRVAARWAGAVARGGDGWAMLLLADPVPGQAGYAAVDDYTGSDAKRALLFAGLAGLGRLNADAIARGAADLDLDLAPRGVWARAIDAAANADQPGTVVLLCAAGMQTADWRGVDPAMLFRMVAALQATGLGGYGRMIAAEAIARLPA